jgi:endonuclease YncB( thermonuclease family)
VPLAVITGSYRVTGSSPDGDSVRFYPENPDIWTEQRIDAKPNAEGGVQLRLDAIDALETHYTPPNAAHPWRQPAAFGDGAATRLLELLGFTGIERDAGGTVTSSTPEQVSGYILTRLADQYGRVVSLAYSGPRSGTASADGTAFVDVDEFRRSTNYQLLAEGWVYPTFYSKFYVDLREAMAETSARARDAKVGIWGQDATLPGFALTSVDQLTDDLVILPKLFRRLAEFLTDAGGNLALTGFKAFLAGHDDDQLYTVPRGQATGLDTLLDVEGQVVRLTLPPDQLVFLEK